MIEKIENLNIDDLDVQELENRLEMSVMEGSQAGWINTDPKPPCTDFPGPGTTPCPPGVPPR